MNPSRRKRRAGRHPRRGAPTLRCAQVIPRRLALPTLRTKAPTRAGGRRGCLLFQQPSHGNYPQSSRLFTQIDADAANSLLMLSQIQRSVMEPR
jgi:hypothetical protein